MKRTRKHKSLLFAKKCIDITEVTSGKLRSGFKRLDEYVRERNYQWTKKNFQLEDFLPDPTPIGHFRDYYILECQLKSGEFEFYIPYDQSQSNMLHLFDHEKERGVELPKTINAHDVIHHELCNTLSEEYTLHQIKTVVEYNDMVVDFLIKSGYNLKGKDYDDEQLQLRKRLGLSMTPPDWEVEMRRSLYPLEYETKEFDDVNNDKTNDLFTEAYINEMQAENKNDKDKEENE